MHIEKNVFDNIFNTMLNIPEKIKDTENSRGDLLHWCYRPTLAGTPDERNPEKLIFPSAIYQLSDIERHAIFDWIKALRFPDGYASNLGRCIDSKQVKMFGMKTHDCHVFMQRLLPIALKEVVPVKVWEAVTELSVFFKDLTAATIWVEQMGRLEKQIPITLCNLERIFPPSFFDSMEHLPVHLPYEAKMCEPVQYRWMYPFER